MICENNIFITKHSLRLTHFQSYQTVTESIGNCTNYFKITEKKQCPHKIETTFFIKKSLIILGSQLEDFKLLSEFENTT
jgi:hypothetical protein